MTVTAFPRTSSVQPPAQSQAPTEPLIGRADASMIGKVDADIAGHQICFLIPPGAVIDALTIDLPGGILILGALRGRVRCANGTALIGLTGEFQGSLEANDIMIEGRITSPKDASGKPLSSGISEVKARGHIDSNGRVAGGVMAISAHAAVSAKFKAVAYNILLGADITHSVFETIVP